MTAYENRLYQLNGFPENLAQQVEANFFQKVDCSAADVLIEVEANNGNVRWDADKRSNWTRFILSLLLRCPEDLPLLRKKFLSEINSTVDSDEDKYRTLRDLGDPETFSDFLKSLSEAQKEKNFFELFISLMNSTSTGGYINSMHWRFRFISTSDVTLFSSDRPVIRTNALKPPFGHLLLPVGPRCLFIAASTSTLLDQLNDVSDRQIALECNRQILGASVKFAYGLNDTLIQYVQKHFGTGRQTRLVETMFNIQK